MPPRYRNRPDGLYDVETSAGFLPLTASDQELGDLGYLLDTERPDLGPDLRLADAGAGGGASMSDAGGSLMSGGGTTGDARSGAPDNTSMSQPGEAPGAMPPTHSELRRGHQIEVNTGQISPYEAEEESKRLERLASEGTQPPAAGAGGTGLRPGEVELGEGKGGEAPPAEEDKGRLVRIPGKEDFKSSWTVEKGYQPPTEYVAKQRELADKRQAGIRSEGERQAEQARRSREIADLAIGWNEDQAGQQRIKLANLRRDYAKRQAKIDQDRKDIDELKVDPDRIYSGDGGTFMRILAAISIISGGALMGRTGRATNPGLDAVNAAIDRDVQLQKEQIARRRQGLEGRETELERLMNIYGSPEMAEKELRDRQQNLFAAYARKVTMNSPESIRANVEQAILKDETEYQRNRAAEDEAWRDKQVEQHLQIPDRVIQVGGPQAMTPEMRKNLVMVDGVPGFSANPQLARERLTAFNTADDELRTVIELAERSKTDPNARDQLAAMRSGVVNALARAKGDKPSEGDFDRSGAQLGSAEDFTGSADNTIKRARAAQEQNRRQKNRWIQENITSDGVNPFKGGFDRNKAKRD